MNAIEEAPILDEHGNQKLLIPGNIVSQRRQQIRMPQSTQEQQLLPQILHTQRPQIPQSLRHHNDLPFHHLRLKHQLLLFPSSSESHRRRRCRASSLLSLTDSISPASSPCCSRA
ncbi:hypothetical protein LINPERHAP1_LOCUS34839 [Linum perenne]